MKLVHDATQVEVKKGDRVVLKDGTYIVTGWRKPHKSSASGFIQIKTETEDEHQSPREYYAGVANCTWIERKDRGWINETPMYGAF